MEGTSTTAMENVWTAVSDFGGGFIGAIGDVITDLTGQPILLAFIFGFPVAMLAIGWIRKLINSRKRG